MTSEPLIDFFWRHFRKFIRGGVTLTVAVAAIHRYFPEFYPHLLSLTFKESLVGSMFLIIVERVLAVEELGRREMSVQRSFWCHPTRKEAYAQVCQMLRARGTDVKRIDLLQFSGDTAVSILEEAAKTCPRAEIRLLLFKPESAEKFDEPAFHSNRIKHTLGALKVLQESFPKMNVRVWSYKTEPGIAGIAVDNWLVSIGWYHVFPKKESPSGLSLRGHLAPAITAVHGAAEPLLGLVREQFEAVLKAADLVDL